MTMIRQFDGVVVRGHGVASGRSADPRFPTGTLDRQFPIFSQLGIDLEGVHRGTISVALEDGPIDVGDADHVLRSARWHAEVPPEDFSSWKVVFVHAGVSRPALIYRPHPDTKPDHHQPVDVVEILAPQIPGMRYGDRVSIVLDRIPTGKIQGP